LFEEEEAAAAAGGGGGGGGGGRSRRTQELESRGKRIHDSFGSFFRTPHDLSPSTPPNVNLEKQ